MKKLLFLALLIYGISCSNPEDRATGNPDSTSFNSDEQKTLNTAADLKSNTDVPDTSSSPATSQENINSKTTGTNRTYGAQGDSSKQK